MSNEYTSENFIGVNGVTIYIETFEAAKKMPTIVFLHDSLGCVALWRDFPEKIAKATECNILVYDRLGYGKSDPMPTYERNTDYLEKEATFLNDLLSVLKLDNVILFGHSDGGSIALLMAAKYPAAIKAVICEAAHIFVEDVTLNGILEAMNAYKTTNLSERLSKYHGNKVDTLFKAWTLTWTSVDFKKWNIEHFLPAITCPLLFIQGEKDEFGSMQQLEKTLDQVSGRAEKYIILNAGHTPHKEASEVTCNAVTRFINELT